VKTGESERLLQSEKPDAVGIYCMAALVADEASRNGHTTLSRSIEDALNGFLAELPRDQQKQALRVAYEMALGSEDPAPPRLRLVYSRD